MGVVTKNGVAHVIEVRYLHFIQKNAILELARIPHHHAVPDDYVFAHIATAANPAIFTDPGGAFQYSALLDDRSSADEDMVADERLAHQLAQDRGLQTKLQVTGNLFESVPNVTLVFEQLRMS